MDVQQLRYFKAVATIGKISEAAESLFISAPALSTSISRLEKEIGARLFDRAGNRIVLNQQGQIFLKHTNHILFSLESAKQEIQQSLEKQEHSIATLSTNAMAWVDLIAAFLSEYPSYSLACSYTSISDLAKNGFAPHQEFLFAYDTEVPPSFEQELHHIPLFRFCPTVMLPNNHPLASKKEITPAQLRDEKLFMPNPNMALHTRLVQLFEMYGVSFPTDAYYTHLARQKMVAENLGVSFASQDQSRFQNDGVVYVPLVDPFEPSYACLYWHKDRALTEHEELFRSFTEQFFR